MKKLLLTFCLVAATIVARAAKADPTPFVVTQPDGTQLTLVLHGDEHFSWVSTLDGILVAKKNKGYYVANVLLTVYWKPQTYWHIMLKAVQR